MTCQITPPITLQPGFAGSSCGTEQPARSRPAPSSRLAWLPVATAVAVLLSGLNALVQVLRLLLTTPASHG